MLKSKLWQWLSLMIVVLVACVSCVATAPDESATNGAPADAVEQTFIIAAAQDIGELNPHNYGSSFPALDMVYEPLVRYAADGTLQPGLAESWTVSEDGLTWTFTLRQGVTFQDGTPFDAAAAKWNLERWVGTEDHNWLPTTNAVASIDTPDDYTLVLQMNKFYYAAGQELALVRPVRFLSPKAVDADGNFAKPVGTGPWQLDEYVKDQRAVFVPYANYWGDKPKLTKVIFDIIPDPQTRVAALQSGEVQLIGGEYVGSIPLESIPALEAEPEVQLMTAPGTTAYVLQMNFRHAPFDDANVRAAVNHAINRPGISKQVFSGFAVPAEGLFPDSVPYVTHPQPEIYAFEPEQAKALLAEAGWTPGADGMLTKDGQPLQARMIFDAAVFPQAKSMAEVIQANLADVGIALETNVLEYSAWLEAVEQGDYDLTIQLTWGAPYDPHSSLATWFTTDISSSHGQMYNSPELPGLLTQISAAQNDESRTAAYAALWAYLDANAAVAPIVYSQRIYALNRNVAGFALAGTEYELNLQNVTIGGE